MKYELKPTALITIVFGGEEFQVRRPTVGQQVELERAIDEAKKNERGGSKLILDHLVNCGLPEHIVNQLDAVQLEAVVTLLATGSAPGSKKN